MSPTKEKKTFSRQH